MTNNAPPIIYIVDDDESVRRAIQRLMRSVGIEAKAFASAKEFLDSEHRERNACLVVDIKMPGTDGIEFKEKLAEAGSTLPVIYITAFDTEETREQAKHVRAAGFLRKPVDDQALLDAIQWALSREGK